MIPLRVELTDFLSHRRPNGKPIVFDFEGAKLWSVSGDNGAGKSAIFDGITWTLYGAHRGGRQDASRLISHGADATRAAFVFEVDGQRYRVERSLRRRGTPRRRAQRWDAAADEWIEIPGTATETGFNDWRDELVSLSYAAFTHSVLLLQTGSDALIRASAKDRFDVLAQLVDLTSYQGLEERARTFGVELTGRRRRLDEELEALEPVRAEERKAATAEVRRLDKQQKKFADAVEGQIAVLNGARGHAQLARRLAEARERIRPTEALLVDAERIRADATEYRTLSAARDKLADAIAALAAAGAADQAVEQARVEGEQLALAELKRSARDLRRAAKAAAREAERSAGKAATLANALPAVAAVVDRRVELAEAEAELEAVGTVAQLNATLRRFKTHLGELERGASKALAARDAAAKEQAARDAELAQARRQLDARHAARDEAVCSRCGQPLDEQHRAAELRRARGEVKDAERAVAAVAKRLAPLAEAADAAARARDEAAELGRQAEASRTEARSAERHVKRARAAADKAMAAAAFKGWRDRRRRSIAAGVTDGLQSALAELEAELEELTAAADNARSAADEADGAARQAEAEHERAIKLHAELRQAADKAQIEATGHRRHADALLADVPPEWAERARDVRAAPAADRRGDDGVLDALDARRAAVAGAVEQVAALERAEAELAKLRATVEELNDQLEAVPAAHRVSVATAEEALGVARGKRDATDEALRDARLQATALTEREQTRTAKLAEQAQASRDARLVSRLTRLLGRQGLQGQLLLDATRSLEALANEILMTLTGGALALEIRITDHRGRDELSVYVRDYNAGGERTEAAFLSGSEKFRVCVAMAAAIGAYGGRRRVESLIIDEGFGSLDEQRRGDMIDELRRLAGLLERVIVVSHQADFQNRAQFPHGYTLRRVDGVTSVDRYV